MTKREGKAEVIDLKGLLEQNGDFVHAAVEALVRRARNRDVLLRQIGVTGGDALVIAEARPIVVAALAERFEGWLPAYMGDSIVSAG